MSGEIEPIIAKVEIPGRIDQVFHHFTSGFSKWWPKEYTWSQDSLVTIGLELKAGGRCTEVGPHNFQVDWGRVLSIEPPQKLEFAWQISADRVPQPNPDNASKVTVCFEAIDASRTRVRLQHTGFEHHGEGAEAYRNALAAEYGWPYILQHFEQSFHVHQHN